MAAYFRNFQTRADLDKAYDVERSVPNFMIYADQWVNNSGQARRHLTNKLGLRFGPTVEEYCDVFPAARRGAPVFIFIHGGYWRIAFCSRLQLRGSWSGRSRNYHSRRQLCALPARHDR